MTNKTLRQFIAGYIIGGAVVIAIAAVTICVFEMPLVVVLPAFVGAIRWALQEAQNETD